MKRNFNYLDPEFAAMLLNLRDNDTDGFCDVIYDFLKNDPNRLIKYDNDTPIEIKIKALENLVRNFEGREKYEECAWATKIINKIKNE